MYYPGDRIRHRILLLVFKPLKILVLKLVYGSPLHIDKTVVTLYLVYLKLFSDELPLCAIVCR